MFTLEDIEQKMAKLSVLINSDKEMANKFNTFAQPLIDTILKDFVPNVAKLTLVADPDCLLTEEKLAMKLREREVAEATEKYIETYGHNPYADEITQNTKYSK